MSYHGGNQNVNDKSLPDMDMPLAFDLNTLLIIYQFTPLSYFAVVSHAHEC